jgi:hypothetical protein
MGKGRGVVCENLGGTEYFPDMKVSRQWIFVLSARYV